MRKTEILGTQTFEPLTSRLREEKGQGYCDDWDTNDFFFEASTVI